MVKKITFVIESLAGGGAQHVLCTVANHFSQIGNKVSVVTMQEQKYDAYELASEIDRVVLGGVGNSSSLFSAALSNFRRILSLRNAIKRLEPDVVISFIGSMNVLMIVANFGLKSSVIISERNDPLRQHLGFPWNHLRKIVYKYADIVSANSQSALEAMRPFVPDEKLIYLPNPLRRLSNTESIKNEITTCPFILSIGRLNTQKRFDFLISAFSRIATKFPEWQLIILGDGPDWSSLQIQISANRQNERIHLLGFCDPAPFYEKASIFVLASDYEGMPNVVLEAMSQSLPVVVTDGQTGLAGFVEDGKSGLVIESGVEEALASAMSLLISEPDLRGDLGAEAAIAVEPLQHTKSILVWEDCVNRLCKSPKIAKSHRPDA